MGRRNALDPEGLSPLMLFPDRVVQFEGLCRCGRMGTLHHLSEIGGPLCEACFPESMERRVDRDIRG